MTEKEEIDGIQYKRFLSLGFEPIDYLTNKNFSFGTALKYIFRAGYKEGNSVKKDLAKAEVYLTKYLTHLQDPTCGCKDKKIGNNTLNKVSELMLQPLGEIITMSLDTGNVNTDFKDVTNLNREILKVKEILKKLKQYEEMGVD